MNMVKQLFHVLVLCKHILDQRRWRHDSVLNHIAGCLKSALVGKSTVELYCDLDGLQAPGGGSIPADIPRNIRPRDMQTSKLLSAMRGGIVVCI
jgi:hypothetical protein